MSIKLTMFTYSLLIVLLFSNHGFGKDIEDCEEHYKDHGHQWVNIYDNWTDDQSQQSPVDVTISGNIWKDFVFLTAFTAATPTSMKMEECVFRVRADNLGVVTTNDVYALPKLYKFKAQYIDFHSKSEHKINGTQYDLEMQIYHQDIFKKSKSKQGMVVSVLFKIGETQNDFFKFLDGKSPLDLSKILPIDFMMHNNIYGYLGTSTGEGWANGVGWYISSKIFTISQADYDHITKDMPKVGNYRESFSIRDKRLFSHPPFFK